MARRVRLMRHTAVGLDGAQGWQAARPIWLWLDPKRAQEGGMLRASATSE